ncbi:MAG: O-antigen ligase family protein [Phycisphaerales bacterium]
MTEPASEPGGRNVLHWSAWCAWAVLMLNALARVVVALDPFPFFEMDPTAVYTPATGLGPTATIALDLAAIAAAGVALIGASLAERRVSLILAALLALGAVPVFVHALGGGPVRLDDARLGISWLAALATGVAMLHLCRDDAVKRLTFAVAIGVVGALAAKGAVQVFVEHPSTVRNFDENRAAILGAHGWSEDSPMARGFERRLKQAEATGWFGLANIYASFAAGAAVALLGMTVVAWRSARAEQQEVPDGIATIVTLGLLAALGAVVLAGAKAGYAVTGLGAVLLAIPWLSSAGRAGSWLRVRGPILGGPLALAVIAAVLSAVIVRGAIGEAISEPSILFRWFYMQGATSVFLDHWLWGTGPDHFMDAYMLAKPAIAPESVESPHSLVFDLAARLGVLGLAWALVFFGLVWRCGVELMRSGSALAAAADPAPNRIAPSRPELWMVGGLCALPTMLSAWTEASMTTPDAALTRAVGLAAWVGVALALLWVTRATRTWPWAFAATGIVLAAHAQIEMTPVQPASAAWFMLVLGAAAARADYGEERAPAARPPRRMWTGLFAGAALLAASGVFAWVALRPIAAWERELAAAASLLRPLAEFRGRFEALPETGPVGTDSIERIAEDLGRVLSRPPPGNAAELDGAMTRLAFDRVDGAATLLASAGARVRHEPTIAALSRLHLTRASVSAQSGDVDGARRHADAAERVAGEAAQVFLDRASAFGWLGTVRAARATMERNPTHLDRAAEAWARAAELDPHGLSFPLQVFNAMVTLGRLDEARVWGARVLTTDERLRLDPLLRLTDNQRAAVERVVGRRDP